MGMTRADKSLGFIVVGVWCELLLYMLELVQGWTYFTRTGRKDSWFLHTAVIVSLLLSTAETVTDCSWSYYITVTLLGQDQDTILDLTPVQLAINEALLAGSSVICQTFLAYRALLLSGNKIVFGFLMACSLATQMMTLYRVEILANIHTITSRDQTERIGFAFLGLQIFTDLLITGVLCFYLLRFRSQTVFAKTQKALSRLMVLSIESGAASTAVAIAIVLGAALLPHGNLNVALVFIECRAYGNTFLFNLNLRERGWASRVVSSTSGRVPTSLQNQATPAPAASSASNSKGSYQLSPLPKSSALPLDNRHGVTVDRTTHVHIEARGRNEDDYEHEKAVYPDVRAQVSDPERQADPSMDGPGSTI